ncbi:hypothetical protein GCM10023177_56650 [Streptomyces violaceoruber]
MRDQLGQGARDGEEQREEHLHDAQGGPEAARAGRDGGGGDAVVSDMAIS